MARLFRRMPTLSSVVSLLVAVMLLLQVAGCAAKRVIHQPYATHIGDSVVLTTRSGSVFEGLLIDADSTSLCIVQGDSVARSIESIRVDSVVRVEAIDARKRGLAGRTLRVGGYFVVWAVAITAVLLASGVDIMEF